MGRKQTINKVILEYEPTPDATERLLSAYEMIYRKIDDYRRYLDNQ